MEPLALERTSLRIGQHRQRPVQVVEIIGALQGPAGGEAVLHHNIAAGARGQAQIGLRLDARGLQAFRCDQRAHIDEHRIAQRHLLAAGQL